MIFHDEEHEEMFNKLCCKMPYLDGYHLSLAYLLTLDTVLRDHIGALGVWITSRLLAMSISSL